MKPDITNDYSYLVAHSGLLPSNQSFTSSAIRGIVNQGNALRYVKVTSIDASSVRETCLAATHYVKDVS
jgi:hypothetical protein